MKVVLHPAAEQDIEEAAGFYEREGSPLVAARFVAEFKRLATSTTQKSARPAQTVGADLP